MEKLRKGNDFLERGDTKEESRGLLVLAIVTVESAKYAEDDGADEDERNICNPEDDYEVGAVPIYGLHRIVYSPYKCCVTKR